MFFLFTVNVHASCFFSKVTEVSFLALVFGHVLSMFPVNEGSVWYRASRNKEEQFKLTTKMKHSIQTNTYAQILLNQGYKVNDESQTYHVLVDVANTKEGQEFSGKFTIKGTTFHSLMKNEDLVHDIVPESVNNTQRDDLQKESDSRLNGVALDDFLS